MYKFTQIFNKNFWRYEIKLTEICCKILRKLWKNYEESFRKFDRKNSGELKEIFGEIAVSSFFICSDISKRNTDSSQRNRKIVGT